MNFAEEFQRKRKAYGLSQAKVASLLGIQQSYLSKIERGERLVPEEQQASFWAVLDRYDPERPLELIFDYIRIRYQTTQVDVVFEQFLCMKKRYFVYEDHAFYGYEAQYVYGDIVLMVSSNPDLGCLLELKGKGCRFFENILLAQKRSWKDFLLYSLSDELGVMKRLDLAVNDRTGLLDIPMLIEKCDRDECITVFRNYKAYRSGELSKKREQRSEEMGSTLYLGSFRSEVYFCIYEKNYERYVKAGIPLEESDVKNRFEIRLTDERAYCALIDLFVHEDMGRTVFGIINQYVRFVDAEDGKEREYWKTNERWLEFIGEGQRKLRLTMKPEPYSIERSLHWLSHQVMPTLKMVALLDQAQSTTHLNQMYQRATLSERQRVVLDQRLVDLKQVIQMSARETEDLLSLLGETREE